MADAERLISAWQCANTVLFPSFYGDRDEGYNGGNVGGDVTDVVDEYFVVFSCLGDLRLGCRCVHIFKMCVKCGSISTGNSKL